MSILVSGSLAYDTIMLFHGYFKDSIVADNVHRLSVAFEVPEMRREFGGTAGNIAYNLKLLGNDPIMLATAGEDFLLYQTHLQQQGISHDYVTTIPQRYTAQAFITTDKDSNQITVFHPGAMNVLSPHRIAEIPNVSLVIIAPSGKESMLQHAQECYDLKVFTIFDPGQALGLFNRRELLDFIQRADCLVLNGYEASWLCEKTNLSLMDMLSSLQALIVTDGANGSCIYTHDDCFNIPALQVQAVDPTGCGDAYRAGLLHGIARGWNWLDCGNLASFMGACAVQYLGGQNHALDRGELSAYHNHR